MTFENLCNETLADYAARHAGELLAAPALCAVNLPLPDKLKVLDDIARAGGWASCRATGLIHHYQVHAARRLPHLLAALADVWQSECECGAADCADCLLAAEIKAAKEIDL